MEERRGKELTQHQQEEKSCVEAHIATGFVSDRRGHTTPEQKIIRLTAEAASLREQLALAASNTAAADLAQEVEFLKAEKEDIETEHDACILAHRQLAIDGMKAVRSILKLDDEENLQGACHRIMAEKEQQAATIARLTDALQQVVDFEPTIQGISAQLANEVEQCPACRQRQADKWPPSGMCEKHYGAVSKIKEKAERERASQHWDLRAIARNAIAKAALEGGNDE